MTCSGLTPNILRRPSCISLASSGVVGSEDSVLKFDRAFEISTSSSSVRYLIVVSLKSALSSENTFT